MRTVQEYQHHAEQCRKLAQHVSESKWRAMFERMAQTWERLAKIRQRDLEPKEE